LNAGEHDMSPHDILLFRWMAGIDLCYILVTSQRFPRTHCGAPAFSRNYTVPLVQ
jgi:hypothetical protein